MEDKLLVRSGDGKQPLGTEDIRAFLPEQRAQPSGNGEGKTDKRSETTGHERLVEQGKGMKEGDCG